MTRGGLRVQLALAITAVAALGVGASFLAVYSGTSSRLRGQIDAQLRVQLSEWRQVTAHADVATPASLARTATRFIAAQRYHAESQIITVQVVGGRLVSNDAELLRAEEARERSEPKSSGLLDAPSGLATVAVAEAGSMRLLSDPVRANGRQVGTLRIAAPLASAQRAETGMQHTFLLVGLATLVLAAAAGIGLARAIASPLRRIARVAEAVDAGELSTRAGLIATHGEVRVLADAFDHMLERLERSFRRQRDFVSDASHELRTPLSVLRAQVELFNQDDDERHLEQAKATLLRRLDELDRLVGDLLTLASAEAGQLIEPREIDLTDFFNDLRRDLPLFGERDFQLTGVDGTLHADPDRLTQVLRNLIRNAVAHTEPGSRVEVRAAAHGATLELSVADNGPGVPPDQLEDIFERFHRVERDRDRDRGGSGLGLAIARAFVEAHGGRIQAESPLGGGATFRIELPGYRAPA